MKTSEGSEGQANQPEKMPQIDYAIDDNGVVTRTDKDSTLTIARYDAKTETIEFDSEKALQFRTPTLRFLNDKELPYKTLTLKGAKKDKPAAEIPKRPKMDPRFGDKTPAVVEWYRRYKPEEYKIRYGIKGPGQITKITGYDTDEKTGKKTPRYETVDATIATRKTHLTEKVEANDATVEEGDDDGSEE